MSGTNNFAPLRQYSTKVYKFTQGKSIARLKPRGDINGAAINAVTLSLADFETVKNGVCAALTAAWLKEKLESPKTLVFRGNWAGSGVHSGCNLDTVRTAVPHQVAYKQTPDPDVSHVLAGYGLTESRKMDEINVLVQRRVARKETWANGYSKNVMVSEVQLGQSMANACSNQHLKQGCGLFISLSVTSTKPGGRNGGHAVGAYRSRGNTLYFFDSNCGVYDVTIVNEFFDAWLNCYDKLQYSVSYNKIKKDRFVYVER